jgi:hypothetical protein
MMKVGEITLTFMTAIYALIPYLCASFLSPPKRMGFPYYYLFFPLFYQFFPFPSHIFEVVRDIGEGILNSWPLLPSWLFRFLF